jgi:F-type H+-transporting ATPase subunit gamma
MVTQPRPLWANLPTHTISWPMLTLEALQTQIHSLEDLQAVVRTMKALAMVSLRQYDKARSSLADYSATVELGFQGLLHHRRFSEDAAGLLPFMATAPVQGQPHGQVGVILFGSDHGLCGPFNEQITAYALDQLRQRPMEPDPCRLAAVGARLIPHLQAANQPIQQSFSLPSSLAGIPGLIQALLLTIQPWCFPHNTDPSSMGNEPAEGAPPALDQVVLIYHQALSATAFQPVIRQLLPLDRPWLQQVEQRPWQSSALPLVGDPWQPLFSAWVRQYLFTAIYRAAVESLASENAARLTATQAAEKNIEERLIDLNADYRQQRQNAITGELLDIMAGFEALKYPSP